MTMIVVRNISSYRVGISSSYNGAHGRPLYLNLGPNDSKRMNGAYLKDWGPGAKEALASYAQNGTIQVDELPSVHEAEDLAHEVPTFYPVDLNAVNLYADALRDVYNAHIIDESFHTAADTLNAEILAAPTDLLTLTAFIVSFQGNFNAHIVLATAHPNPDTVNGVVALTGTLPQNIAALQELTYRFSMHKRQGLPAGAVTLTVPQIINY
jgi:hypothetical protein